MTAADVLGKRMLNSEAEEIRDTSTRIGAAGDSPGVNGGAASVGWHLSWMETWSIGSGVVDLKLRVHKVR